jgi:acetyltransferase-like isoleucine patch superfamily enzyme
MLDVEREKGARAALRRLGAAAAHGFARTALHGVDALGARPIVEGVPFVENLGHIFVGDDLVLSSIPVRSHLATGRRGVIRIGDGVTIGAGAAIAAEDRVEIGDGVHLDPSVMILDSDYHGVADREAPGARAPIVIGAHARLGERVTVLRGAAVGAHARIEAGSVVSGVIPDHAFAAGVPARAVHPHDDGARAAIDLLPRVQRIAAEVFALSAPPAPGCGPRDIPGWDSLGALRLLVSLEDELGIALPQDALAEIRDLAGLSDLLARRRTGTPSAMP